MYRYMKSPYGRVMSELMLNGLDLLPRLSATIITRTRYQVQYLCIVNASDIRSPVVLFIILIILIQEPFVARGPIIVSPGPRSEGLRETETFSNMVHID